MLILYGWVKSVRKERISITVFKPKTNCGFLVGTIRSMTTLFEIKNNTRPRISMIVPVWRDDALIPDLIRSTYSQKDLVEWIIATVDPSEMLQNMARDSSLRLVECSMPSRGAQMNAGAQVARGSLLCFHHADTEMTPAHLESLLAVEANPAVIGGAFHRRFDDRHRWMCQWEKSVQAINNWFGPVFGDQSIFVKSWLFHQMGGFADIPLMEDIEFSRRLRSLGRTRLLHPPISSSPRRFKHLGNWTTSFINISFILLFYLGASPHWMHRWYYRKPPEKDSKSLFME